MEKGEIAKFVRNRDYVFVSALGRGGCGQTVLLNDDTIDQLFVCKKYLPYYNEQKQELYKNFVQEIKLLHLLYHKNVVRVFNHYLYPNTYTGYIIMEYIEGDDIETYLGKNPENINEIFMQVIEGFCYLENCKVLHRDIRPMNILVDNDAVVKIIDFGFGKRIILKEDFDKSISLNPWCQPPNEFNDRMYDFVTEIYFIGKLFEKIIKEKNVECFKYTKLLLRMCDKDNKRRISKFIDVENEILSDRFLEIEFSYTEKDNYQQFANTLIEVINKIAKGAKHYKDIDEIQNSLESLYKTVMLEECVPDNSRLIRCFINGAFSYYRQVEFPINVLQSFLQLLRQSLKEKRNIILGNIHSKLNSIPTYEVTPNEDEIPF